MADFTLDDATNGVLGGGQYTTVPFPMTGEFRDIQLHWSQSGSSQDAEPHYLEFHFTVLGVDASTT